MVGNLEHGSVGEARLHLPHSLGPCYVPGPRAADRRAVLFLRFCLAAFQPRGTVARSCWLMASACQLACCLPRPEPRRTAHRHAGAAFPEALGAAAAAQRLQGLATQLQAASSENQALRRQLAEQQVVRVPPSLQAELGSLATASAVAAAAADIEARLQRTEVESTELRQQLGLPAAASPAAGSPTQGGAAELVAVAAEQQAAQLAAYAAEAMAAGEQAEFERLRGQAGQLEALVARLREAESERQALARSLQELQPVRLQISASMAAAEGGAEATVAVADELVEVPPALQEELGGAMAPAGSVEAKGAELEARLDDAGQQAAELRQQLRAAVAVGHAVAAAAVAEQQAAARLKEGGAGGEHDAASLRQMVAAARQQKEAAQAQQRELQELQGQLHACSTERRRLSAQLASAERVGLTLAVSDSAQQGDTADAAELRSQLAAAQQHSADLLSKVDALAAVAAAEPSVRLALQLDGDQAGASERLAAAEAEADRLRRQLEDLQVSVLCVLRFANWSQSRLVCLSARCGVPACLLIASLTCRSPPPHPPCPTSPFLPCSRCGCSCRWTARRPARGRGAPWRAPSAGTRPSRPAPRTCRCSAPSPRTWVR